MVEGAKKNVVASGKDDAYFQDKQLTADSNYHSLNSLTVCKEERLDAYIPDIQFRKRDARFADQERFKDGIHGRQRPDAKSALFVHKRMHRFTLRSKLKVDVQWRLFALVHNIGKIHVFGALT